jgi:hypothetical protein
MSTAHNQLHEPDQDQQPAERLLSPADASHTPQLIQLEPYDDAISIRDRLAFMPAGRVLLVLPKRGKLLHRKLDLVLVQRQALRGGQWLALVTDDMLVHDNASALNVSSFFSVSQSERAPWKRPQDKLFVDRAGRPQPAIPAEELRRVRRRRLRAVSPAQRQVREIARVVLVASLLVALSVTLYLFVPSAEVRIYPAQSQINTVVRLLADPAATAINVETGQLPAMVIIVDVKAQASIPTTGSRDIPSTLASGTVVFTNQTPQTLLIPAGTVVTTFGAEPARFRTVSDVTLSGGVGRTVQATIEAAPTSAGSSGNVDANLINFVEGPLAQSVTVRNPQPTRGGSLRQSGVVTKADYDNLLLLAREKIKQTSLADFNAKLTGTQFIAPDTIRIVREQPDWISYSADIGDPVNTLTLDMRAKVQAVAIDEAQARQATLASLSGRIPRGQQIVPESVQFTRGALQASQENDRVPFFMSAAGSVTARVNVEHLRQRLAGVAANEVPAILERELLLDPRRPPQIDLFPSLLGRLPVLPVRITIRVIES